MNAWPDIETLRGIHARMRRAAEHFRLPIKSRMWRGNVGNWMGMGIGSSIDFQDHRPYLPGDDPRYIDWLAYARSGLYTMKLYREEVSPRIDLLLDGSESMFFEPEKQLRSLELLYFCYESALRTDASLRGYLLCGTRLKPLTPALLDGYAWGWPDAAERRASRVPQLSRIPWRAGALRVFISDLLYPESPVEMLNVLTSRKGRGVIFAPFTRSESEPDWLGNLEFVDCESRASRIQRVEPDLLQRYAAAYRRHFDFWGEHCRKHDVLLARLDAAEELMSALHAEAYPAGAIEVWT